MRTITLLYLGAIFLACSLFTGLFLGNKGYLSIWAPAAPSTSITATLVPNTHGTESYQMLWLRSPRNDLALGVNLGHYKDSSFGTRIHDSNTGPKEYSCFPDDLIFAEHAGKTDLAYAGYLKWENSADIKADGSGAFSQYRRTADQGLLADYIEPEILSAFDPIKADITVKHELDETAPFVKTSIHLKNAYSGPAHFYWVYQDGMFLYLPNQNQAGVEAISAANADTFGLFSDTNWVGLFEPTHGIASVLYAPKAKLSFLMPRYFGVQGFERSECASYGYSCKFGGNDRFRVDGATKPEDLITHYQKIFTRGVEKGDMKILGAIFDLGTLEAGHEALFTYYRLGLDKLSDKDELRERVAAVISKSQL